MWIQKLNYCFTYFSETFTHSCQSLFHEMTKIKTRLQKDFQHFLARLISMGIRSWWCPNHPGFSHCLVYFHYITIFLVHNVFLKSLSHYFFFFKNWRKGEQETDLKAWFYVQETTYNRQQSCYTDKILVSHDRLVNHNNESCDCSQNGGIKSKQMQKINHR